MALPGASLTLRDAGDLRAVGRALGRAKDGRRLKRNLVKQLKMIEQPILRRVRLAWRTAPSHQSRRRGQGLRAALARVTRGEVRLSGREAGIRIRTDGRRMPAGMKALPSYVEGTKRPWRHRIYGTDVWVTQRPFPRFYMAARPDQSKAKRQVEQAVADVFKEIARSR